MDRSKAKRVVIVGGESLAGREVRELLADLISAPAVELISGEPDSAKLARDEEGEAVVLNPMRAESFTGAAAIVLAGTRESSRHAFELTAGGTTPLIDMTAALEDQPNARLRAPQIVTAPEPAAAATAAGRSIHVVAHPAAVLLAMFYGRLAGPWTIRQSVVEVFEPASERGQRGLHELQSQTVNLLSFKPLPQDVYDAQVGFNLLPALGSDAAERLDEVEARIERHLASLLAQSGRVPMPSLRLIQAPVFHGYSCSLWIEFESAPTVAELEQSLTSPQIEVRKPDEEPPTNVGAAGQTGLTVGDIRKDRNNPRAFWFWLVADNIRTFAESTVAVVRENL